MKEDDHLPIAYRLAPSPFPLSVLLFLLGAVLSLGNLFLRTVWTLAYNNTETKDFPCCCRFIFYRMINRHTCGRADSLPESSYSSLAKILFIFSSCLFMMSPFSPVSSFSPTLLGRSVSIKKNDTHPNAQRNRSLIWFFLVAANFPLHRWLSAGNFSWGGGLSIVRFFFLSFFLSFPAQKK